MSKRVNLTVNLLAYEGNQNTNDPADATKVKNRVEEAAASELFRIQTSIADATSDQEIELPDAETDYLLILTDQVISAKLNGSEDSISLNPKTAGSKCTVLLWRGVVTQLQLSNASGAAANVDIVAIKV